MKLFGMVTTKASGAYTNVALRSFIAHTPLAPEDRFVLIDNDGGYRLPDEVAHHQWLSVHRNDAPRGFAANANFAVDTALRGGADLYFLNNDLVFTPGWIEPLLLEAPVILSPLSNREVQFSCAVQVPKTGNVIGSFSTKLTMNLEEYQGNESALETIARANTRAHTGALTVFVLPFFCVKIPHRVMEVVGHFDESFGRGGGEDYDYALRAWLAGSRVQFMLNSYVLHFGGRSSYSGGETKDEQLSRESQFKGVFREKWGEALYRLILEENDSALTSDPVALAEQQRGDMAASIRTLMGERDVTIKI